MFNKKASNNNPVPGKFLVLMESNRLSPRLKSGEHVLIDKDEPPELECCVLVLKGDNFHIEIFTGHQTNIIGSEVARYMKNSGSIFSQTNKITVT